MLVPQVLLFSDQRSNNGLGLLGYSIFRYLRLTGLDLPAYNALDPSGDDPLQFVSSCGSYALISAREQWS